MLTMRIRSQTQRSFHPELVLLENRTVPSLSPTYRHVNAPTSFLTHDSVSASSESGSRVVVWVHDLTTTNSEVRAQRFFGQTAVGNNFIVASNVRADANPAVCMDGLGRFFVSFTRRTSASNRDVVVRRFTSSGAFVAETVVAATSRNEYDSSIACSAVGNFAVSYTTDTSTTNQDLHFRVFTAAAVSQKVYPLAISTTKDETLSAIAVRRTGPMTISAAYVVDGKDVVHRRFNALGVQLSTNSIATSGQLETNPSVAMDNAGNAVVAFQHYGSGSWNIWARVVLSTGDMGATRLVQGGTSQDTFPTVAMDLTQPRFVVAYQSQLGNSFRVIATEMTTMTILGHHVVLADANYGTTRPSIAIDGSDRYIVSFVWRTIATQSDTEIFARFGLL